jgi:hypothetical protein
MMLTITDNLITNTKELKLKLQALYSLEHSDTCGHAITVSKETTNGS